MPSTSMRRFLLSLVVVFFAAAPAFASPPARKGVRVRISFPAAAHAEPVTGRVYVAIARESDSASSRRPASGPAGPIQLAGPTGVPLFGVNVENLAPGAPVEIDGSAFGHPVASLNDIPKGEYVVQAFVNVYT